MSAEGRTSGLAIRDRRDAALTSATERSERLAARSRQTYLAAQDWARSAGFPPSMLPFAAMAAVMLRSSFGPGRVTRALVLQRLEAQGRLHDQAPPDCSDNHQTQRSSR